MGWFANLRTVTKLLLVFSCMMVLLGIVAATAYTGIRSLQYDQRKLYEGAFSNAVDMGRIRARYNESRGNTWKMFSLANMADQQREANEIKEFETEIRELLSSLRSRNENNADLISTLGTLEGLHQAYFKTLFEDQIPVVLSSIDHTQIVQTAAGIQSERIEQIRQITRDMVEDAEASAKTSLQASQEYAAALNAMLAIVALVALFFSFVMGWLLNRTIAHPLTAITGVAARVAERDLTVKVDQLDRRDEVGILSATFARMIENLRSVTQDINEGVNVLASTSSEILASSTQVASGATETASAVHETSTTVEEVKQTAQVSSQKAKAVSESAQRANETAALGGQSVQELSVGMHAIRDQIQTIVDRVMGLSEQSQSIGSIIATVDDLAEQSNLLAVNAAIEAAKAGEQGKGFAVVAQEVRNLAEQSKESTKQVRQILNDIQKSVSSVGMATEQGSKAAESGIKQAEGAARAIHQLVAGIGESSQAAVQIAASSQQQLAGMDQVALAMENIRDASEQNVSASRQVEESARILADLGQNLKRIVETYRVDARHR